MTEPEHLSANQIRIDSPYHFLGNPTGFVQVTNFPASYKCGDYVKMVFLITLQFLLRDATYQISVILTACSKHV